MQKLWSKVCSPRHLMVFETAARHLSFTGAAGELNVQQPAVSMAVRQLEEALGVTLFDRNHRRVSLTSAGERLFADATRAFEILDHSADAVRQATGGEHVTLNASTAFNNYWMMPRLSRLKAHHPQIDLRLQSSDREPDIDSEGISLAIRRGDGDWPGCQSALIAPEIIYPVAAPWVMAAAVNLKGVPSLLHQRLIHLEEPVRERPGWQDWFAHFGIRTPVPASGLRLNDYALVLQAAMAGEGFAFGWKHVTDRLVGQGLLKARSDWQWTTGKGFYLVWSHNKPLSPAARTVRDWILQERDAAGGA